MYEERIRRTDLRSRIVTADKAQDMVKDGMTVGVSGFTRSGDAKAVPRALVRRLERTTEPLCINLYSGASLAETDTLLSQHNVISRRLPYQSDSTLRSRINAGEVAYTDQHLSHTAEWSRNGLLGEMDISIIEAVAITEDGGIVPTTSVGNSPVFVEQARQVIVELNVAIPEAFEGIHDIYLPENRPHRQPIPLTAPSDRVGQHRYRVTRIKLRQLSSRTNTIRHQPLSRQTPKRRSWQTTSSNFSKTRSGKVGCQATSRHYKAVLAPLRTQCLVV